MIVIEIAVSKPFYDWRLADAHASQKHDFVFDVAHASAFQVVDHWYVRSRSPQMPILFIYLPL